MKATWTAAAEVMMTATILGLVAMAGRTVAGVTADNLLTFPDATGQQSTLTTAASFDLTNPFFKDLGTNGRTCVTCHQPSQAWTITPAEVSLRFNSTRGLDPIFRNNDWSNCEGADISTLAGRRTAFSLLLSKGLIRVGLQVPANAEFKIVDVDDPYRCGAPLTEASMYRRPLPATNLGFLSTVMWDGRETVQGQAVRTDLRTQARDATTGHAQAAVPPADQLLDRIVDFELALFTAQTRDDNAGGLTAQGALGGPTALSTQAFCIGINDPLGMLPSMPGACGSASGGLDPLVFTIFDAWSSAMSSARQAIARGQRVFNTRQFVIDNVAGLNASPSDPVPGAITTGTCTICHDAPNAGNHSIAMPLNIGIADVSRRTPDLPLYTLQNKTTLETVQTTDPGRAMVTGKWADVGKFKGPVLRALAARAPFFHNGSASTLADVVEFYNTRFNIGLTPREKADLVAFLGVL